MWCLSEQFGHVFAEQSFSQFQRTQVSEVLVGQFAATPLTTSSVQDVKNHPWK